MSGLTQIGCSVTALLALSGCCFNCSSILSKAEYYLTPNHIYLQGATVHKIEVHADTLRKNGGNTKSPEFITYTTGVLKDNGLCPKGWRRHTSDAGADLSYGTRYSVVLLFQCS